MVTDPPTGLSSIRVARPSRAQRLRARREAYEAPDRGPHAYIDLARTHARIGRSLSSRRVSDRLRWHAYIFTREVLNGLLRIGFLYPSRSSGTGPARCSTRTHYWFSMSRAGTSGRETRPGSGSRRKLHDLGLSIPEFIMGGSDEEKSFIRLRSLSS